MSEHRQDQEPSSDSSSERQEPESFLLGVGLDGNDGHRRITRGDDFHLEGGSEETHERMQETIFRVVQKLERKGRHVRESSAEELTDLIREASDR